ncbi:hypothetical protein HDE_10662 [Halotydeus destructor]|nr:hypothetical protein HDE_10662 [Halotydeus destructor]
MENNISQETKEQLKLFQSIDGVFNDFKMQAVGGEDTNIEIMRDIVGYVYCDAVTIEDTQNAYQRVEAGHRYLLDDLVAACSRYLVTEVNPASVLSRFVLSDRYNLGNLKEKCLTFKSESES